MSIRQEIAARCQERRLFNLLPMFPNRSVERTMLISEEINRALFDSYPENVGGVRIGQLRRDFDRFTEGGRITIRDGGYKSDPAYMARLDPPSDEIWEIRSVDPRPALRVLGLFAEADVFVALLLRCRKELGGKNSKGWIQALRQCKATWRQLFPHYNPHSGKRVCDYVSTGGLLLCPLRSTEQNSAGGPLLLPCMDEGEIS